jgi:hypothetical protein
VSQSTQAQYVTAFKIFARLIAAESKVERVQFGYFVKNELKKSLRQIYPQIQNSAKIPVLWQQYFLEVNEAVNIINKNHEIFDNKYHSKKTGNRSIDIIQSSILNHWRANASEERFVELALACYFWAHVRPDGKLSAEARSIDRSILQNSFQDVFGEKVPETAEAALALEKKYNAVRETSESISNSHRNSSFHSVSEDIDDLKLSLWVEDANQETRFLYRSRAIPYIHADLAFQQLDNFCAESQSFLWHIIYGPGGTGKSRLALEYALSHVSVFKDAIGFLASWNAENIDWFTWQPSTPTFIIVDYAAREILLVEKIVRHLSMRQDLQHPVRLLLLERDINSTWFSKLIGSGQAERFRIEECWFGEDGGLEPPEDVWPIIQHMCAGQEQFLPDKNIALQQLEKIDPHCRPLYAAFLGDAYSRGENPRKWNAYELVENVLKHEEKYWLEGGVKQSHRNLCACATATGGIPEEWVYDFAQHEYRDYWPVWEGKDTIKILSAIYGLAYVGDVPPLEPDILGEAFFLEYWKDISRFEQKRLLKYCSLMAPWFVEFLERVVTDFPNDTSFDILCKALKLDFEDYEKAKPELLFNCITGTARAHPKFALKLYELFKKIDKVKCYETVAECVVDSAFNLISGIETLNLNQVLEIYAFQLEYTHDLEFGTQLDLLKIELASGLIDVFKEEDYFIDMRFVLLDMVSICYRNRNNSEVLFSIAGIILNMIENIDENHVDKAELLLSAHKKIMRRINIPQDQEKFSSALYHVFLLQIARIGQQQEAPDTDAYIKAFHNLEKIAPEARSYKNYIFRRLADELNS